VSDVFWHTRSVHIYQLPTALAPARPSISCRIRHRMRCPNLFLLHNVPVSCSVGYANQKFFDLLVVRYLFGDEAFYVTGRSSELSIDVAVELLCLTGLQQCVCVSLFTSYFLTKDFRFSSISVLPLFLLYKQPLRTVSFLHQLKEPWQYLCVSHRGNRPDLSLTLALIPG